jgi:hypothetical protein
MYCVEVLASLVREPVMTGVSDKPVEAAVSLASKILWRK